MENKTTAHIFVVEDDAEICAALAEVVEQLGYACSIFRNGAEARQHAEEFDRCDLVITDYYLPDMTGVDLVRMIRERRPSLKAILLTGSREPSVVGMIRHLDNCVLLHKPIAIEVLEGKIKEAVS